jgi:hypothetical protein
MLAYKPTCASEKRTCATEVPSPPQVHVARTPCFRFPQRASAALVPAPPPRASSPRPTGTPKGGRFALQPPPCFRRDASPLNSLPTSTRRSPFRDPQVFKSSILGGLSSDLPINRPVDQKVFRNPRAARATRTAHAATEYHLLLPAGPLYLRSCICEGSVQD